MRVGELSEAVDLPIPTIKYYLREGLLPAGEVLWSTRSVYDESHAQRLRLIRVLTEVGRLSLQQVRAVLAAVDDEQLTLHDAFGVAQDALVPEVAITSVYGRAERQRARGLVDDFIGSLRWRVRPDAAVRDTLATALIALWRNGWDCDATVFAHLAAPAAAMAAEEIATIDPSGPRGQAVAHAVVGTVAFEQAFGALRRLALEHESAARFTRRRSKPTTASTRQAPAAGAIDATAARASATSAARKRS